MATKAKKSQDKYKPNQFVVHPHHGAAKVIRKVNKNVEIFVDGEPKSKRIQYFEIEVLIDGLTVMVPVESVDEVIRPVISKNAVSRKVFPIFKEKPEEAGTNWSRWYKVLTEQMTSGDVIQVAEVVRDLYKKENQGEQSYSERQMYQAALERLAGEFAAVQNVDKSDAATKLEKIIDDSAEQAA